MAKTLRMKIAYWFFLAMGMIGVSAQVYKYLVNELPLTFGHGAVTAVFGMFIFKPTLLVELYTDVKNRLVNIRNKVIGNKNKN